MQEPIFETVTIIKEFPYSFKVLRQADREVFLQESRIEKVLSVTLPAGLMDSPLEGEDESEPQIFLLTDKKAILVKGTSAILYPTLGDLENFIAAVKAGQKQEQKNPIFYTKIREKKNPKERVVLDQEGIEHIYWQYEKQKRKELLETFPVLSSSMLGQYTSKLTGQDGRIICDDNGKNAFLFSSEEDFKLWYYPPLEWGDTRALIWRGRNPYHADVLNHKEDLLQQLADIAGIKREEIQFGKGGHGPLHLALEKLIYNDGVANKLFLPLTIYLGELQIAWYGGEWQLQEAPLIKSWVPIVHFQGYDYDIGSQLYYDLLNPEDSSFPSIATVLWSGKTPIPAKLKR